MNAQSSPGLSPAAGPALHWNVTAPGDICLGGSAKMRVECRGLLFLTQPMILVAWDPTNATKNG